MIMNMYIFMHYSCTDIKIQSYTHGLIYSKRIMHSYIFLLLCSNKLKCVHRIKHFENHLRKSMQHSRSKRLYCSICMNTKLTGKQNKLPLIYAIRTESGLIEQKVVQSHTHTYIQEDADERNLYLQTKNIKVRQRKM